MSNAFPPHDGCPVPTVEAIGEIDINCLVSDPAFPCLGLPIVPPPPSFDFGCYPLEVKVDWDPAPSETPEFTAKVVYLNKNQTGYCRPQLRFRVRMGAAGCGNVAVMVLADYNVVLSGCQTIDGIYVCEDDRVITIAQTDPKENDVWVVKTGAWERYETAAACNTVVVRFGDVHARETWRMENTTEPEHGVDTIIWVPVSVTSLTCRLRLTNYATLLDGVQEVDGRLTEDGDFIAVDYGALAGPNTFNGVWIAKAVGPWTQLYATEDTGDPAIPVLAPGSIVTVWDGYSSPWLYVVGTQYYNTP